MLNLPVRSKPVLSASLLLTLLAVTASAQDYRGKVQGIVTDPSQAAVAGADVTLKNANTGIEESKKTDSVGHYLFDFVQPGTYSITVQASGFQKATQESFSVLTRGDVTVNVALVLGGVATEINVTTEVNAVEFNTSTMTTTVQGEMLKDLPVLARNPFTLALLNPAVVNQYWDVSHRNPFYMWSNGGMDIGGPTGGKNDQEMDGTSLNISARGSYNAPMDAVQEVAVQQNAMDAEFGFSAGGTLNLSMKSGTNGYHGTAYYFGRNPAMNALANRITRDENPLRQSMWGGTIGHPIVKNKLFNFFAYEGWRATQPNLKTETLPTDLERTGDFSQTKTPAGDQRTIYDPLTTRYNPATELFERTPFADNKIPQDRIDPTAKKIMADLWKPNNAGDDPSGTNNFKKSYGWWLKYWNFTDRADYNINDRWRVFGRFSKYQTRLDNPNWGGTIAVPSDNGGIMDAMNTAVDILWMASPKTTVNVRMGVTYDEDDYASQWAKVDPKVWADLWPNSNWYTNVINAAQGIYYPRFRFDGNGYAETGVGGWWVVHGRSYNPTVNVTHEIGSHHLKAGWQLRYSYDQDNASSGPGTLYFSAVDTGNSFKSYDKSLSGSMYASALLGVLNGAGQDDPRSDGGFAQIAPNLDVHQQQWGLYLQDDYRLNRNVTLNLGLRWERETAPLDELRRLVQNVDLKQSLNLGNIVMPEQVTAIKQIPYSFNGAVVYTSDKHPRMYDAPWTNFLPRAGVAIRVNDRTAVRAGYARYAVQWLTIHPETGGLPTWGYSQSTSVLAPLEGVPRAFVSDPFPAGNPVRLPVGNSLGANTKVGDNIEWWDGNVMKTPINDRFNFTVQRQAPANIFTEATFFMSFAHNMQDPGMWGGNWNRNINQLDPNLTYTYKGALDTKVANPFYHLPGVPGSIGTQSEVSVGSLLKPYPQYGDMKLLGYPNRQDHYYSLQLKAERPIKDGIMFLMAYNYGRESISDYFNAPDNYAGKLTMLDRGQPRHNIRAAGTWEIPVGRGLKYGANMNRVLDTVIGGWATSHILQWRSGTPVSFKDHAAAVSGDPTKNVPAGYYFNPAVFSVLDDYTPRTNPWFYSGLNGPRWWQLDSTIVKYFKIGERARFELRMEMFNSPNAFMPSDPDMTVGNLTNMGRSLSVAGGNYGREIQYTGRIHF